MIPQIDQAINIPRFALAQLATEYTAKELKKMARDVELEAFADSCFDDAPQAPFLHDLASLYREAAKHREEIDQLQEQRKPRRRRIDFAAIKAQIDLVQYVRRYMVLNRYGRVFKGLCPFHSERTPSFIVWPDAQRFKCFGCQASGDVITFRRLLAERGLDR